MPKNPEVISDIINEVKNCFVELYIVRSNKHTFLRMNVEIKEIMIQVYMVKYLEECIGMFGDDVSTLVTSTETKKSLEGRADV